MMSDMNDDRNIIKLRGLPWNSTNKDILDFLKDCCVVDGEKGIHLAISHRDGRPNGEAFVELASQDDVHKAFEYNNNILGHRYIEIFNAKPEEFEFCMKQQNRVHQDTFIKLRGLPFSANLEDIESFFDGLEIRNGTNGIYIVNDGRGRPTGEAFVQFSNSEDTDLAMKKNREKIGHRYIEIFRSSSSECRRATILNSNGRGNDNVGFNNDRGFNGRGQRNNRSNFRDRPYPDLPWGSNNSNNNGNNDAPWRNNNRGNNNYGGGSNSNGGNNFNSGFGGGNNSNPFNNNNSGNSFSADFERNWNSGGNNSYNSFGGGNSGPPKNNYNSFDRDIGGGGFNNFNNNSNSGSTNGNFGNDRFMNNNGGGNGNNNGGGQYGVHLRGMPYDCGESDVQDFFAPLEVVNVEILYNNNGRHTGEADAYFSNVADAQEAMKKHKEKMGSRYIELFAKSNERRGGGGGGGGRF